MLAADTRVISTSRGKTGLLCLGSVAFVASSAWLIGEVPSEKAVVAGWVGLSAFGLTGLLGMLQLIWPSRLVLDRDGLTFHWLLATFRRNWTNICEVNVVQIKSTKIVKLVAKPGHKDLALSGAWPVSADELAALIERYRTQFVRANAA